MKKTLIALFATLLVSVAGAASFGLANLGWDNTAGGVCVLDRAATASCVRMGLVDSVNHWFLARNGVDTTADLTAISVNASYPGFSVRRNGYYAAGDGGAADYTYSATACSLNSGAGDGGYQIKPTGGTASGCWTAQFVMRPSVAVWGTKGTGPFDDGPALRAALNWCSSTGYGGFHSLYLPTPPTVYIVGTLDTSGNGGLVAGNSAGTAGNCRLTGEAENTTGDYQGGVNIKLGNALNRPLLYVPAGVGGPFMSHIRMDGNGSAQTGWTGGPNGKLYTVQVADGSAYPESSVLGEYVVLSGGYNGNLYVGSGRGATTFFHLVSQYSGQGTSDSSIYMNGYDAEFWDIGVGSNAGTGIFFAEGSQYQLMGGASYYNNVGIVVNGGAVNYWTAVNFNFQYNKQQGLIDTNTAPFSGQVAGSHVCVSCVFDGNSAGATGTYPDVYTYGNNLLVLESPLFIGNALTGTGHPGGTPNYNVSNPSALVTVSNPRFGATPNTSGAFQFANAIQCANCAVNNSWAPVLAGSSTAGSPTYVVQTGYFSRNNNELTVRFHIQVSSLGGAAGNLSITGLPLYSGSASNNIGECALTVVNGWTGVSGRTTLTALVLPNVNYISLNEIGSGASSAFAQASEFAASTAISGTCTYGLN